MMQRNGPENFRGNRMGNRGKMGGDFRGARGGGMGAGFRIAPMGMWWKSPMVVQRLTLTPEQTKKMDGIFEQSRLHLIDLKANVEKQNALLEPLLSANPPDTVKAMAQIDKVAEARAELEKADARMLLGIRGVLTPEQWTKLHEGAVRAGSAGPADPAEKKDRMELDADPADLVRTLLRRSSDCAVREVRAKQKAASSAGFAFGVLVWGGWLFPVRGSVICGP